jgi:hypothetical protein
VRRNSAVGNDTDQIFFQGVGVQSVQSFEGIVPLPAFVQGVDEEFDPT